MIAQQYILNVRPEVSQSFDNFIVGSNAFVVSQLSNLSLGRLSYLFGPQGVGKTHLLRAVCKKFSGQYMDLSRQTMPTLDFYQSNTVWAFDQVDKLDEAGQACLFDWINQWRNESHTSKATTLVLSGVFPPIALTTLREDLRNRLGWDLVLNLKPLVEDDVRQAFIARARALGMEVNHELINWIFTHTDRDAKRLLVMLEALDKFSLANHKRPTIPLIKKFLEQYQYES